MSIFVSNEDMAVYRKQFVDGKHVSTDKIAPEILKSWKRCAGLSVDPNRHVLPKSRKQDSAALLTGRILYNLNSWLGDFVAVEHNFLSEMDAAIFAIDDNLNIFDAGGDSELLHELQERNLTIGTNLAESNVGTNAASLARLTGRECWVVGNEHYMQALTDYVCASSGWKPVISHNFVPFFVMFVVRQGQYQASTHRMISLLLSVNDTFKKSQQSPLQVMRGRLIDICFSYYPIGYLIIDKSGVLLQNNEQIYDFLGDPAKRSSEYLGDQYPELRYVLEYIRFNRQRDIRLLNCSRTQMELRIELTPMYSGDALFGATIFVSSANQKLPPINFMEGRSAQARCQIQHRENTAKYTFNDLYSVDPEYLRQIEIAKKAASSSSSVLILGESGTGKELIAQSIHTAGVRRNKPFISINCGAIPRELLDSELFGYVDGAFTGARRGGAPGKIEMSSGGTLFLDEIGEMPLDMQVHLLRVLEERVISRLGDTRQRHVDLRVIASTNKSLNELCDKNVFRQDLLYRLGVVMIELPPLRERKEDVCLLSRQMLEEYSEKFHKPVGRISPEAMALLEQYYWPGNARELRNMIERSVLVSSGSDITPADLPRNFIWESKTPSRPAAAKKQISLDKNRILFLLQKYRGNKSRVARELGISRPTMYQYLKDLGISETVYKK